MVIIPDGSGDFYHRYRPKTFDEIFGNSKTIESIRRIPTMEGPSRAFLFYGESGCGKTTTARVLAMAVNCLKLSASGNPCLSCQSCRSILSGCNSDICEINAADNRGIDDIRRVKDSMFLSPMSAQNKVFIFDECHSLTKDAQHSFLKVLEEAPRNVFIILCSTDPGKLLPTVKNRCQSFNFPRLPNSEIFQLVSSIMEVEGLSYDNDVVKLALEASDGSPRKALVILQQVFQSFGKDGPKSLDDIKPFLPTISESPVTIDMCRSLMSSSSKWADIVKLYRDIQEPPEVIRLVLLGYFRTVLLGSSGIYNANRCERVMDIFINPFYEVKPENALVLGLYKAFKVFKDK